MQAVAAVSILQCLTFHSKNGISSGPTRKKMTKKTLFPMQEEDNFQKVSRVQCITKCIRKS